MLEEEYNQLCSKRDELSAVIENKKYNPFEGTEYNVDIDDLKKVLNMEYEPFEFKIPDFIKTELTVGGTTYKGVMNANGRFYPEDILESMEMSNWIMLNIRK